VLGLPKKEVNSVQSNDFEKAYGDFIDRKEYDRAAQALHDMVRISFTEGWNAAGGDPPSPNKIFEVIPGKE
jgi:hypothetical protein